MAVGDSLPVNSMNDCPGCTGFVDLYAKGLEEETGHPVEAHNFSEHTGLQAAGLSEELDSDANRRAALQAADVVIVSIGYNDAPWNVTDDPCDGAASWDGPMSNLEAAAATYTPECAEATAQAFKPRLASIYERIVALREGRADGVPAVNRYNDFIGWCENTTHCEGGLKETPSSLIDATRMTLEAWNPMVAEAAAAEGFLVADLYHEFNGPDGAKPSGAYLADDYTHPSQLGNDKIAELLLDLGVDALAP